RVRLRAPYERASGAKRDYPHLVSGERLGVGIIVIAVAHPGAFWFRCREIDIQAAPPDQSLCTPRRVPLMRVILLGTGAALVDPDRNHSSILITVRGRNYLFDCGHGATHQLMRAGIDPVDIDVIFLSHLHFDHIADFPYFMLSTWIFGRSVAPVVIGPPGTEN